MSFGSTPPARRALLLSTLSLVLFALGALALLDAAGGVAGVQALVVRAGPWAPITYVVLKAIATILPPVSGTPLRIASGALFGLWEGTLLSLLGDTLGGSASFWISRLQGRRALALFVGEKNLAYVDSLAQRSGGWRTLLFVRLIFPPIYNYVSYAAGLTTLPFRQYVAVTALAGILPTAFTVAIGAGIAADRRWLALIYGGLATLAVIALIGRHYITRIRDGNRLPMAPQYPPDSTARPADHK
ncbi:MAG: TVP38/TMEM64 family protein [Chloroflexota bacterium]|nr:TVP38/TMEM64 family protein [Chloroflexota bacterium]